MKRWQSTLAGAVAAAALVIGGGGVAFADSLEVEVDSLQAGVTNVNLGTLGCGAGDEVVVDLFIARGGNAPGNTYKSSSTVEFSKVAQASVTADGPAPASVVIPSGWAGLPPSSDAETTQVTSKITIAAGSANGSFSGAVTYRAAGTAADFTSLVKQTTVNVSWKVENCVTAPVDSTAPVVTLTCPDEPIARWAFAVATWVATDEVGGSGLKTPATGEITLDTASIGEKLAVAPAGTAIDNALNESLAASCSYTVVDTTPPVVLANCPAAPVLLGSTAEATWTATDEDGGSGLATPASGSITLDTSSVGSHIATIPAGTAVDNAGNTSLAVECDYWVVYDFDGFFRPVDMGGVVNSVKAGSAVPIKFSLNGDQGLDILATGSPTLTFTPCAPGASVDPLEETVTAGGSSLSYDAVADQYVYVWKTAKLWAGKCGTFGLKLDDGTTHTALFSFTK